MPNPTAFDTEKVLANVRRSSDEDLLNRVTVYRSELEPEAATIIERELLGRGVGAADIANYRDRMNDEVIRGPEGAAVKCSVCRGPAVAQCWGWRRLFGVIPIFPRYQYRCKKHQSLQP